MENFVNYYELLGVTKEASFEEIKKQYRKLTKMYHPDVNPSGEKIQKQLNEAYEILSNMAKRQEYDQEYAAYEEHLKQEAARKKSESNKSSSSENKEERHQAKKKSSSATDSKLKKMGQDIKKAWEEVRTEEKKSPFFKRHKKMGKAIYKEYHKPDNTEAEELVYKLKSGTLHVFYEMLYQLKKLTYITTDTLPKFVIRNRVPLSTTLALIMVFNLGPKEDIPRYAVPETGLYSTDINGNTSTDISLGESIIDNFPEEKINQKYSIYHKYTVQPNDTLSHLAIDANTSIEEIQEVNGLSNSLIKIGETLYIPYNIEAGDLRYATVAAYYPAGTSLEDFAKRHNTTAESLIILNEEAFEAGQIISDTLLVPTFPTPKEITEQKDIETPTYKKTN